MKLLSARFDLKSRPVGRGLKKKGSGQYAALCLATNGQCIFVQLPRFE